MRPLVHLRSSGSPGGRNAPVLCGETVAGLLQVDMPGRGGDSARGGGEEGQGDLRHCTGHAQTLLHPGERHGSSPLLLRV
jgi:hypothetical protein